MYKWNPTLESDLKELSVNCKELKQLEERSILVTGATGLVGSLLIRAMAYYNQTVEKPIQIYAFFRNFDKAKGIYGPLLNKHWMHLIVGDVTKPCSEKDEIDYIIHCAGITASRMMVENPVETIFTSLEGTRQMLDFARHKKVKGMVYISSMEVYGSLDGNQGDVTEDMLGFLNPLEVRSDYPESKRMCKNLCVAYASEYDLPIKIARLAQTFGAGILPGENRVFAQFAKSAVNHQNIVLHTRGLSEGNYCYSTDMIHGVLLICLKGEKAKAYNVANEQTHTTIADMATLVAREIAAPPVEVIFDIPKCNVYGYAKDTKMKLDSTALRMLGWEPKVDLKEAYIRLTKSMCGRTS